MHRVAVAMGIGAAMVFGPVAWLDAQPPPQHAQKRQDEQKENQKQQGKQEQKEKQEQKKAQQGQKQRAVDDAQARKQHAQSEKKQVQAREKQAKAQAQAQKKHAQVQAKHGQRLAGDDQQARIRENQQRVVQYRDYLAERQRLAERQSADLQRQNRAAHYRFQQEYVERLRQQQARLASHDRYNYDSDPYFYTPPSYRYSRDGRSYETNQYGVDLLRQAVNYGYVEGRRAGLADRQDRWDSGYEDAYAYQDANYGYGGFYVDRDDYNDYFREGFRRGYDDGYNSQSQYGRYSNGRGSILDAVLSAILNFESIR